MHIPRSQLRLYGIQLNRRNLRRVVCDEEGDHARPRAEVEHALAPREPWEMCEEHGVHREAEFIRALDDLPPAHAEVVDPLVRT